MVVVPGTVLPENSVDTEYETKLNKQNKTKSGYKNNSKKKGTLTPKQSATNKFCQA